MKLFDKTQYSYWGTFLSFDTLWVLSIFGGILALDHLYIRSPLTFILKMILNIITLGTYWIYDALQVTFNKDSVKLFGLSFPTLGSGLGAGMFASPEQAENTPKTHLHFLYYSVALIFGGLFGADAFVLGNNKEGLIRLFLTLSAIFLPLALIIYFYKLILYFFKTDSVIEKHWEYFGAPKPDTPSANSIFPEWMFSIPLLNKILPFFDNTLNIVKDLPLVASTTNNEELEASFSNKVKTLLKPIETIAKPIANTAVKPVTDAIASSVQPIVSTIQTGEDIIEDALNVASKGINTVKTIGEGVIDTTKSLAQLSDTAIQLTSGLSPSQLAKNIEKIKNVQEGGSKLPELLSINNIKSDITPLSILFIATIAFISVSGLVISYKRLRQNEQYGSKEKDDSPPRPRTARVIDSKEHKEQ